MRSNINSPQKKRRLLLKKVGENPGEKLGRLGALCGFQVDKLVPIMVADGKLRTEPDDDGFTRVYLTDNGAGVEEEMVAEVQETEVQEPDMASHTTDLAKRTAQAEEALEVLRQTNKEKEVRLTRLKNRLMWLEKLEQAEDALAEAREYEDLLDQELQEEEVRLAQLLQKFPDMEEESHEASIESFGDGESHVPSQTKG